MSSTIDTDRPRLNNSGTLGLPQAARVNALQQFFPVVSPDNGAVALVDNSGRAVHVLNQPTPAPSARERSRQQKSATVHHRWASANERERGSWAEVNLRFLENHSDRILRITEDIPNDKTLKKRTLEEDGETKIILFCTVCEINISANKSACRSHLLNNTHMNNKKKKKHH